MRTRNFLIAGGVATLAIALTALPSPSVPRLQSAQEPQEAPVPPEPPQTPGVRVAPEPGDLHDMVISLNDGNSWLGVETQEVDAAKVKDLKLPAERGVVVGKVLSDSPAAKAGLKENDVITAVDGQPIEGTLQFRRIIHEIPAGRKVQLTVWRDGQSQTLAATLGTSSDRMSKVFSQDGNRMFSFRMPEARVIPDIPPMEWSGDFLIGGRPRLGVEAEDLEGQLGKFFGAPDGEGVLIQSVNSGSPAEKAGIKAGDVITSVNGERIRTVGELRSKLAAAKDSKNIKLSVLRNKTAMAISVELPEPTTPKTMTRHMAMRSTI